MRQCCLQWLIWSSTNPWANDIVCVCVCVKVIYNADSFSNTNEMIHVYATYYTIRSIPLITFSAIAVPVIISPDGQMERVFNLVFSLNTKQQVLLCLVFLFE